MSFVPNRQIAGLKPSASMQLMAKAKAMKAADPAIIDLAGGEPDFDTPEKITQEAIRQLTNGYTHYTVGPGLPELRAGIAQKLLEENGCHYAPEGVVVTPGAKYAIYLAVRALANSGDEVLYLNPAWVSYISIIEAAGAVPVGIDLRYENDYRLELDALEEKTTNKTKALIINYPNNPTGKLLHVDDLAVLKAFMLRHPDIYVISDEIYERIRYDGKSNLSPAADVELLPRVITVNGFSKSVAMTGWRIGYLAADAEVAKVINKLFQHTITNVSGFIQKAAVVALTCKDEIEQMRAQFERRRDLLVDALNAIPGVRCVKPEGAFYAWVSFDLPGMDSSSVTEFILNKAKVVGVPGIAYGVKSPSCMRFSFAASDDALRQAAENIAKAMEEYQHGK